MQMTYTQRARQLAAAQLERLEAHINERGDRDDNLVTFFRKKSEMQISYKIATYVALGDIPASKSNKK